MYNLDSDLVKDIESSFTKLENLFNTATLLEFINTHQDELEKYNFGVGTIIRLKLLNPKRLLYKKFAQHGFYDADKISMIIMVHFHEYMKNKYK